MKPPRIPDFLMCGSSASGTSFLTAGMMQHPEIYFPKEMRPEPHFFYKSWEYEKGFDYYLSKYFMDADGQKAAGERSSSYMFGEQTAVRIRQHIPNARLIFILRNPIERTWANYRYTVLEGLEELAFEEVLQQEPARVRAQKGIWTEIQPHNYTGRGFYYEQMMRFIRIFPASQLLVLKSEDVRVDPDANFKRIFEFLGVDKSVRPSVPPEFTSVSVRDRGVQVRARAHFGVRFDPIIESIRRCDDPGPLLVQKGDDEVYATLKTNLHTTKESMSPASREYLQKLFESDIQKLAGIVDFSVDDWR